MGPLLALAALSALPAQACSCAYGPHERPCQAMMNVEIAFIGRVISIEPTPQHDVRVLFRIDEAIRGISGIDVEVFTSADSCGIAFDIGKPYFIHARRGASGRLFTGGCGSHTSRLEHAQQSIDAIRNLTRGESPVQIFGFATSNPDSIRMSFRADPPTAGVRLLLKSGEQRWEATTDSSGEYSFADIPAGEFHLSAELPDVPEHQKHRKFQLKPGECRSEHFLTVSFAGVAGTLLDSSGIPVPRQAVKISGIPPTRDPQTFLHQTTDSEGRFRFDALPAGHYKLSVNTITPPNSRDWFGKRSPYLPVTSHPFTLKDGHSIENIEFRLLPMPLRKTITGTVILPDGSPAKALVSLLDPTYPSDTAQVDTVRTSESGTFELQLQEGRRYLLFAQTSNGNRILHSGFLDLTATTPSPLRVLLPNDDPSNQCAACRHFRIWESPLWQKNP